MDWYSRWWKAGPHAYEQRANVLLQKWWEVAGWSWRSSARRRRQDRYSRSVRRVFWSRVGLHKTFRVYEGSQDALLSAIRQELRGRSFIFYEERLLSYISVPSRIYTLCTSSRSLLSSFRFSAKDVFNVKGLRKIAGSRACYSFHSPYMLMIYTVR